MSRKGFFVMSSVLVLLSIVWIYAGSKTSGKISVYDKNVESIKLLQNRLIDEHDLVVNDLDTLFTLTGSMSSDSIYRDAVKGARVRGDSVIATAVKATRMMDGSGSKYLGMTKRYSITAVGNFDTTKGNTTAQGIILDSLPASARIMDAWAICTQLVTDEADTTKLVFDLSIGTEAGGHQIADSTNCDTVNEVVAMSAAEMYDVAPAVTRTKIYLTGYPAENWTKIFRGAWNVFIQYINNGGY